MEIMICVAADNTPEDSDAPREAYRLVDWPAVPEMGTNVYPFLYEPEFDREVRSVGHHFALGYILLDLEPMDVYLLVQALEPEKYAWLISTKSNIISVAAAFDKLSSKK